jgi:hypothetical protein
MIYVLLIYAHIFTKKSMAYKGLAYVADSR